MTEEELQDKYSDAYSHLKEKTIFDLRTLARGLGIAKPTTMQKEEVIMSIMKVASGEESASAVSGRGARPKARGISAAEIDELMEYFKNPLEGDTELKLSANELTILAELVYMGNYVINNYKRLGEVSEKHFEVANEIFRNYYTVRNRVPDIGYVEENEVADARDLLCDRTKDYIARFEKDVFLDKLTEMLKEKIGELLLEK